MSWKHLDWATQQKTGSATRKLVLLMLADRTNKDTGKCRPSIKCIARDSELSETAVKDAVRALEEQGLIRIEKRSHEGVSLPNEYELLADGVGRDATQGGAGDDPGVGRQPTQGGSPDAYKPGNEPGSKPGKEPTPPSPQGGKPGRAQFDPTEFDSMIPIDFQIPEFTEAWHTWVQDRKDRKKPMTAKAAEFALIRLAREAQKPATAVAWIRNAIEKSWQGIYQPHDHQTAPGKPQGRSGRQTADDSFIAQLEGQGSAGVPTC